MKENKLLTIVIPAYNVSQYLKKGLDTLTNSKLEDTLEVLIVNDGSKDNTPEIASAYVLKYPKIFRLINKENGGHGSVINTGIDEAKGRYFRIIDGDDWVITDNLIKLLDELSNIDTDIVADIKRDVDMTTGIGDVIPMPSDIIFRTEYKLADAFRIKGVMRYFMIHNFSVKTSLLKKYKINVLEKVFYEDSEYVLKAISIAKTIVFLNIEVYQYMVGNINQSISTDNFVKRYSHFDTVTKAMLKFSQTHKSQFVTFRIRNVILTQYYIAFIYNKDRKQGRQWAKSLNNYLKGHFNSFYQSTKMRYRLDLYLHKLGIDYNKLQKLRKLLNKK